MNLKRKIGIYGGTFNPPHIGHVRAAEAFSKAISPDVFYIMPDNLPPHKQYSGTVSPIDRLNMAKIAFGHINNVSVSDHEIKRGGKSYTSVTLEEFSEENTEIYFLCGTDMFLTLHLWYRPEVIFNLSTIAVVRRECDTDKLLEINKAKIDYRERFGAKIIDVPISATVISSSELREKIAIDCGAEEYIPCEVLKYIREKGLYK